MGACEIHTPSGASDYRPTPVVAAVRVAAVLGARTIRCGLVTGVLGIFDMPRMEKGYLLPIHGALL